MKIPLFDFGSRLNDPGVSNLEPLLHFLIHNHNVATCCVVDYTNFVSSAWRLGNRVATGHLKIDSIQQV